MLSNWIKPKKMEPEIIEEKLDELREILSTKQTSLREKKRPVMVIVEGWSASGKGSLIGKIIKNLDPRFFKVSTMSVKTEEESRKPFLYRHFIRIPQAGKYTFFDGSWMDEVTSEYLHDELSTSDYKNRLASIKHFERQLTDNGYLVVKLFLHIDENEQRQRIDKLLSDKNTKWRVSPADLWQNKHYRKCREVYDSYLSETNLPSAPWYIIDAESKKHAELQALDVLIKAIDTALMNGAISVPVMQNIFPLEDIPKLSQIPLDKTIEQDEYKRELYLCQNKLRDLHNELYRKKIPVILAYEGWDAAGKGGNIKRITSALDPRGYEVHPIASPEPHEKARHYLWRFWNRLPKDGHIAIFDRTWYGRVMVERLEGFCSENDWQRAYNEINEFEYELASWGAVVIKFWVQIDKDVQLERFTDRQNTPSKQWKITDEDWRNREKWDLYETAIDEMLQKTNTTYAPWVILESNNKKYARIKALKTVIEMLEKKLK